MKRRIFLTKQHRMAASQNEDVTVSALRCRLPSFLQHKSEPFFNLIGQRHIRHALRGYHKLHNGVPWANTACPAANYRGS